MTTGDSEKHFVPKSIAMIEAERKRAKISRAKLCRRADVNESTLHRIIKGDTTNATSRTLSRLKRALGQMIIEAAE